MSHVLSASSFPLLYVCHRWLNVNFSDICQNLSFSSLPWYLWWHWLQNVTQNVCQNTHKMCVKTTQHLKSPFKIKLMVLLQDSIQQHAANSPGGQYGYATPIGGRILSPLHCHMQHHCHQSLSSISQCYYSSNPTSMFFRKKILVKGGGGGRRFQNCMF